MLKIFLVLILMTSQAWASWRAGTGENTLLGSSQAADIDTNAFNSIVNPLDNLLANYRQGMNLIYDSASQLTASSGSITVSNADGSVRLMLRNSGDTTITWADIDTGAEGSGTTYYVYAIAASTSSTAATFKISANSTSPSGITYYKRLGYFINDGSSNIAASSIVNDNLFQGPRNGDWASKSIDVAYQAATDGMFIGEIYCDDFSLLTIYTDASSSPSTERQTLGCNSTTTSLRSTFAIPVRKGDYYKASKSGSSDFYSASAYFLPNGS